MPVQALIRGEWRLHVEGEAETMALTFRGGLVFENGLEVGASVEIPDGVRATVGEDVVLLIAAPAGGWMDVTMVTRRPGEPDLVERARLVRSTAAH